MTVDNLDYGLVLMAKDIIDIISDSSTGCLMLTKNGRLLFYSKYNMIDPSLTKEIAITDTQAARNIPDIGILKEIIGYEHVTKIFGQYQAYAFISDGLLYVFGENQLNRFGIPSREASVEIKRYIKQPTHIIDNNDNPILNIKKVAFGHTHMLILTDIGLYAGGTGEDGILGSEHMQRKLQRVILLIPIHDINIQDIAAQPYGSIIVVDKHIYHAGRFQWLRGEPIYQFELMSRFEPVLQQPIRRLVLFAGQDRIGLTIYR
jgi:alpha-tubulin suppressor-like RCC1 family protein